MQNIYADREMTNHNFNSTAQITRGMVALSIHAEKEKLTTGIPATVKTGEKTTGPVHT